MGGYSLDEILKLIVKWEKGLDSFYDVMEEYLVDERSRKTTLILQERQKKAVDVLKGINIADYARTEFIKNVPDIHSGDLIPHFGIDANSPPRKVFETILGYEEKLEEYYEHLRGVLVYEKSKDLLDMLLKFKVGQIKEIKSLMDNYDLAL
jgi:hypothetical protein